MFRKSLYIAFAFVLVMAFALSACAGQAPAPTAEETAEVVVPPVLKDTATPAPAVETEEPTAAPEATEPPAEPTEAAAPAEEAGEFVLNGVTMPFPRSEALVNDQVNFAVFDSFNDMIPNGNEFASGFVQISSEGLWYVNYATGEVIPWLAESHEYSADYKTITIHLRKGVTWSDGEPFTSADLAWNLQVRKDNPKLGANADLVAFDSIETPDDFTVVIHLTNPTPRYHQLFWVKICTAALTIYPKHIWEDEDPLTFKNNPPVVTGPYVLDRTYPEQKIFVWKRNENYWNKDVKPGPKYVIYRTGPGADQQLAEIKSNNMDIFGMDYNTWKEKHETEIPQINVVAYVDPCPRGAFFNTAHPKLSNADFRRALSMLMNREKWAQNIWIPPSKPAIAPWADYRNLDQFINQEANEKWGTLTYNPEKAKEIFTSLGYKTEGGKLIDPQGEPVSFKVTTPVGPGGWEYMMAQDFIEEMKAVGIDATLQNFEQPVMFNNTSLGNFEIGFWWMCGATVDPVELYSGFECKDVVPIGEDATRGNEMRFCDPEFDEVVEKLKTITPDDPAAHDLYMKAYDLFLKGAPGVPLVQTYYTAYYNTTYWNNMMSNDNLYTVPFNWWGQILWVLFNITPK